MSDQTHVLKTFSKHLRASNRDN